MAGTRHSWRGAAVALLTTLMAVSSLTPAAGASPKASQSAASASPNESADGHDHGETFGHPVAPVDVQLIQPDGATFPARPWGHGAKTGYETLDGYTLAQTASGEWRYADGEDSEGKLKTSARRPDKSGGQGPKYQRPTANNGPMLDQPPAEDPTPAPSNGPSNVPVGGVNSGTHNSLVILAQFANQSSLGSTAAQWNAAYFGATGSVAHFFSQASYGNFTFGPATETSGTANDGIVGWVTLASNHPNTGQNTGVSNQQVTKDAILAADPFVNFGSYDTNNDGVVKPQELHVTVIVAGFEASYGGVASASNCGGGAAGTGKTMWGHRWAVFSVTPPSVDSKSVGGWGYTQFGEQHCAGALDNPGHPATIGIMAHEMGHDLGWPDLYDTTPGDGSSAGIGLWSLMASGSWGFTSGTFQGSSPSLPDAFSKYYQGWVSPTAYTAAATGVSLLNAATNSSVAMLGSNPNGVDWSFTSAVGTGEYFLVENRQQTGYDASLPSCGVLVWHIDETRSSGGDANGATTRKLVDLEEADGLNHLDSNTNRGDAGDPFPGTAANMLFSDTTTPNARYYNGSNSNLGVDLNSNACAATMSVDIIGPPGAPTVTSISPAHGGLNGNNLVSITGTNFVAGSTSINFKRGTTNNPALDFDVNSPTSISALAPSSSAGMSNILVTTPNGTSADTPADNYEHVVSPAVTSISPNTGSSAGGTTVTINGSGFKPGATTVSFGGTPATVLTNTSATSLTATAPAHSAGAVDVSVTTIGGTSPNTTADNFTYTTPPTITVTSPNGGESFAAGSSQPVTWTSTDLAPTATVKIDLIKPGQTTPFSIIASTPNDGTHLWPIQAATTPDDDYKIRVRSTTNASVEDLSNADFTITGAVPPSITVTFPNGGEALDAGTQPNITWDSTSIGPTANVKIELIKGAAPPVLITSSTPNDGLREWMIPGTQVTGSDYKIKVTSATNASINDLSDATFTINGPPPPPPPPTVTSVTPNAGNLAARTVAVTGTNFLTGATVRFLTGTTFTSATNVTITDTENLTATLPSRTVAAVGRVVVTNAGGASADSSGDNYSYWPVPTVTAVTPNRGDPAGGNTVTIAGGNLVPGQTSISFGGVPATIVSHNTPTSLTVTAPAQPVGAVHVNATAPGGTSANAAANVYTYALVPTVSAVSPNEGELSSQQITVTGTNFLGATTVKFLVGTISTNATNVVVDSDTQLTAILPSRTAAAAGSIIVTTSGGSSANTSADDYQYFAIPTVTAINPKKGDPAGGNTVTITGANLIPGKTSVSFGSVPATIINHASATSMTVSAPAQPLGAVHVRAFTPGGGSPMTAANLYNYVLLPTVASLTPSEGDLTSETITVTGTNFVTGATTVKFLVGTLATAATNVVVTNDTTLTATLAARTTAAAGRVVATTAAGESADSPGDGYTYFARPTITAVTPNKGDPAGGNSVTITGTNLAPGKTSISFGGGPAVPVVSHTTATSMTVTAAAGTLGTVDLIATTPGGQNVNGVADNYTYALLPTVTEVSPNQGPLGQNIITITGTNFVFGSTVKLLVGTAATNATNVLFDGPSQLQATVPARTAAAIASVLVTTPGGTSANTSADDYRYFARPTISSLSPNHYWDVGGNSVTVNGTHLIVGETEIRFGGNLATITAHTTANAVTVTVPPHVAGPVDVTATTPGGTNANLAGDNYTYIASDPGGIEGYAFNAADDAPIAGLCVQHFSYDGFPGGSTVTDSEGYYSLTGMTGGTYEVIYEDCSGAVGGWGRQSSTVIITSGSTTTGDEYMTSGAGHITGTIRADGNPAGGACASLHEVGKNYSMRWLTGAAATYTLNGVRPGAQYKVIFTACNAGNLATQYWNHTSDWNAATILSHGESQTTSGVDADLEPASSPPSPASPAESSLGGPPPIVITRTEAA